jgi:hypothetical protein
VFGELLGRRKVVVGEYQVSDGAIKNPARGGGFLLEVV